MAPEAAVGGTIALVKNGDLITLDADKGLIQLGVTSAEIKRRRTAHWKPRTTPALQGRCSRRIRGARVECERRRCPDVIASESIPVIAANLIGRQTFGPGSL